MKKNLIAVLLSLMLLISAVLPASADFGSAGNMVSPAVMEMVPQDSLTDRFWCAAGRYTWSYAPLFFKPEERNTSERGGPAAADPEANTLAVHVKLPRASAFTIAWINGWAPDRISVTAWKPDALDHPDSTEEFLPGTAESSEWQISLDPDRLYQFHAVWEQNYPDDESGEADYYIVTEQMTAEETAAAEARVGAPFSDTDLQFLTLKIENVDCVLGTTTPRDLKNAGIYCSREYDGTFTLFTSEDPYGYIYAFTMDGTMDSPVISINAFWAYDIHVEYCGVPGYTWDEDPEDESEEDEDDEEEDEIEDEPDDENALWGIWAVLAGMTDKPFFVEESPEGISSVIITLSNGRELSVSEHSSPVSLYLLPEKGTEYQGLSDVI